MPATKLGKKFIFNPVKQLETFNRLIDINMAEKGIKTDVQLAAILGLNRNSLSQRRLGHRKWQYEELCRLFRALEFSPEEVARAMGVAA